MKKVVLLLAMFGVIMFTSCTDNSLEELEKKNESKKTQLRETNPGNDGTIGGDDDDEETGSE